MNCSEMKGMKYSEISDIQSIDAARREISEKLDAKGREVVGGFSNFRETCTPETLLADGIRRLSGTVPLNRIVLFTIRLIKSHLFSIR